MMIWIRGHMQKFSRFGRKKKSPKTSLNIRLYQALQAVHFLFYTSTVITLVTCWRFAVVTVWLLELGHLDEDGSITTVCENKRFSSFFANALLKFNIQLCNHWKLLNRLNVPDLSGNSPQIYECYWSACQKKLENLLFSEIVVIRNLPPSAPVRLVAR